MSDCLFCKIIKGEIPAEIVAENDHALAFRDINPQASTHVLIIPKVHISSTRDLNNENIDALSQMALLANEISDSEGIKDSGYRWVINTGNDGGQTVFHIHLHLLGGRQMNWPPG
jgi:histidine triad (HIT) family protein|tara:strand:- start:228 stop:572 length:345 start_codon:yes stop_codon:yes gene_type:complete